MLAKIFRFHGHGSVRSAYRYGRSVRGAIGSLHVHTDPKHPTLKVAVVVSKKVSKSAVVRNRIRRRVFSQVQSVKPKLSKPAELVFTIYDARVALMPSDELAQEVTGLLSRAKLL